jgi:tripartite-type tricarboxylate transporter receptor subunit TctC
LWHGIVLAPNADAAQNEPSASYPAKPVRIVVPFGPGGNIDMTARTIAPGLSEALGQQVVVDNRGGAGGRIGSTHVAKSPADGYTILLGADGTLVIQPTFSDSIEYQPLRDFVFTSPISLMPGVLVVHPSLPVRSVRDIIALAKARPATLLMASPGNGSAGHLTGELFQSMARVKFVHVPYKGGGAASIDLISGQVDLGFEPLSTPLSHIRAGRMRAIAVTTRTRLRLFPDIPTIDESGVPGFETTTLTVLALPAATPKEIVEKVRGALLVVLEHQRVRENFEKSGGEVAKGTPDDYVRRMREELAKWAGIRKETGIRVE